MAEKKIPFTKPDPQMIKLGLRMLRDQMAQKAKPPKAQRGLKRSAAPSE